MKKGMILLMAVIVLFTGCGTNKKVKQGNEAAGSTVNESTQPSGTAAEGFTFQYNDVVIPMNANVTPIIEDLGEPDDYFEAASCAFQGLDKIYYYSGFELGTYPNGDKDYVSYVTLLDDSVTTDKGVYVGSTLDEVTAVYGSEYTVEGTSYVYQSGETKLTFIVENEEVTQITYYAIVEGLNN